MTIIEALKQHAPALLQNPEFQDNPLLLQQIQAAMQKYTEEKALDYARFYFKRAYLWSLWKKNFDWKTYTAEHPLE